MPDLEAERPDDPWLTIAEIAEELRMSPATIRSWISNGTLQAMRPGRRKWLVRRSELDRMLAGDDMSEPDAPPGKPSWRTIDTIAPPHRSPHWTNPAAVKHVSRLGWLGAAESEWREALQASAAAPPDPRFILRIRAIAEAAARKAAALENLGEEQPGAWWQRQSGLAGGVLSYELRPGGNRPGPAALWLRFDAAVEQLGAAMQTHSVSAERHRLEQLSLVLHEIADALEDVGGYPWAEVAVDEQTSGRSRPDVPEDTEGQDIS